MSGLPPTEAELIARALDSRVGDIYTACPGIVKTYDAATQTADVQPAVQRSVDTTEDNTVLEDLPIVPNVKVCFPRGGGFSVTWPIAPGDSVLLVSCNYSPSQWRAGDNSQTVAPGDLRLHHVSSSFAIPILAVDSQSVPNAQASLNAFTIVGPMVVLGDAGATDFAALSSKVDSAFQSIATAFAACTPGPQETGLASLKAALSAPPSSVASTKVKLT